MKAVITLAIDIDPGTEDLDKLQTYIKENVCEIWNDEGSYNLQLEGTDAKVLKSEAWIEFNPPRKYAELGWQVGDITSVTRMTDEEAEDWLLDNQNRLRDAMCESGWGTIHALLDYDGIEVIDEAEIDGQ